MMELMTFDELTSSELGFPLDNGPKFSVGQENSR